MDADERLDLFREMVGCGVEIYTWEWAADHTLIRTNCPDAKNLAEVFEYTACLDTMFELAGEQDTTRHPVLLGAETDLIWAASYAPIATDADGSSDPKALRCVTIGPVFFADRPKRNNIRAFSQTSATDERAAQNRELATVLARVPVVPGMLFMRYALMLHFALTGEKLNTDSIDNSGVIVPEATSAATSEHDRRRVWLAERALLGAVRTGDLDYQRAYSNSSLLSAGVPVMGTDPLRQTKTSVMVFTSLVVRAAIEGGLSPEVAYPLGDTYIRQTEAASSVTELTSIAPAMYDDFIHRVHAARTRDNVSEPVRVCRDYIETHLESRITADTLARAAGYSSYYLTRVFHEELGCTVSDYVRQAKIARAQLMLESTDLGVTEIAEVLKFSSRSYFCRVFREATGETPGAYRTRMREPRD